MNAVPHDLPLRVIKLGGSLLALDDVIERFYRWHALQSAACDIVIVGGGAAVDELRATQQHRCLDNLSAHWLAIECMSQNAAHLAKRLNEFTLTNELNLIERSAAGAHRWILDPKRFLRDDHGEDALPANWEVTSDSIAARVAECLQAIRLVLLKSTMPEPNQTILQLAESGYVDRFFSHAAKNLPVVECVNLRNATFPSMTIESQTVRAGA